MSLAAVTRLDLDTRRGDHWEAAIDEIEQARGRTFRVYARLERTGEILHDYYEAASLDLARAVKGAAVEQLRAGRRPDLQLIARDLKRRDTTLATLARNADGVVLLGDTAPDEAPPEP